MFYRYLLVTYRSKNTTKIWVHEIDIGNPEIYETPATLFLGFRYKTFIYLFEYKVFRHEERQTHLLTRLTFPSDPTTCGTPPQTTGLASASSENQLASSESKSQLTDFFFKFPNPQPIPSRPGGGISYLGFLLWYLWLSHSPRAWTPALTVCT